MEKIMAIVNPISGGGRTKKVWPDDYKLFVDNNLLIDYKYTLHPGHATELTELSLRKGYRKIMAVGGDGTVNEVINGMYINNELIEDESSLIILPRGSGSDFIKSINIAKTPGEIIKMIKNGKIKYYDLGQVTYVTKANKNASRFFINVLDAGIGGETVAFMENRKKVLGGIWDYFFSVIRTIIRYKNKKMSLFVDNEMVFSERMINSIIFANGGTFAGGMNIAPGADPEDGRLNIIILGNLSRMEIIINLSRAYKGKHLNHPKIKVLYGSEISLDSKERVILDMDGEYIGKLPLKIKLLPHKLPLFSR